MCKTAESAGTSGLGRAVGAPVGLENEQKTGTTKEKKSGYQKGGGEKNYPLIPPCGGSRSEGHYLAEKEGIRESL